MWIESGILQNHEKLDHCKLSKAFNKFQYHWYKLCRNGKGIRYVKIFIIYALPFKKYANKLHFLYIYVGIFYYRPDFSEPKLLNLRFFNQSLFFYSSPPDCLEEAFSYSLIQNCQTSYPVPIPQRFELIFDKRCCLSYERTVSGEFSVEEVICSFRQNLETCILEIRQIEKELELNCVKLLNPKKREIVDGNMDFEIMTLPEAMSQLTKEDLIIEKILGQEVVVEESIKCCVCEADKNRNSTNNSTQNGTENGTSFFMF